MRRHATGIKVLDEIRFDFILIDMIYYDFLICNRNVYINELTIII